MITNGMYGVTFLRRGTLLFTFCGQLLKARGIIDKHFGVARLRKVEQDCERREIEKKLLKSIPSLDWTPVNQRRKHRNNA